MPLDLPAGRHGNERVIEYNWVLNQIKPNSSVLDIGTVAPPIMSGYPEYVFSLTRRMGCRYTTMDVMPGANLLMDIREAGCLPPKSFDYVVAISTLEHITIRPDAALRNMAHIGKNVLVTMPYGLDHEMTWGFNYGPERLANLLEAADFAPTIREYYAHFPEGWTACKEEQLQHTPYGAYDSEAAGVVCFGYLQSQSGPPA